jgi:hypothetical protein
MGEELALRKFGGTNSRSLVSLNGEPNLKLHRFHRDQLSLRALYSVVMLDVAWSLFELRMFRAACKLP